MIVNVLDSQNSKSIFPLIQRTREVLESKGLIVPLKVEKQKRADVEIGAVSGEEDRSSGSSAAENSCANPHRNVRPPQKKDILSNSNHLHFPVIGPIIFPHPPPRPIVRRRCLRPVHHIKCTINASPEKCRAQTLIASLWRSFYTRKKLADRRMWLWVCQSRTTMIQRWWRSLVAKKELKKRQDLRTEWIARQKREYEEQKFLDLKFTAVWRSIHFFKAAELIQKCWRWCQRRNHYSGNLLSPSSASVPLVSPFKKVSKIYFPHRKPRKDVAEGNSGDGKQKVEPMPLESSQLLDVFSFASRESLSNGSSFTSKGKKEIRLLISEIIIANEKARQKQKELEEQLSQPEVQKRIKWHQTGVQNKDMEMCAGVIQRRFRILQSRFEFNQRLVYQEYMTHHVSVLQRFFWRSTTKRKVLFRAQMMKREIDQKRKLYEDEKIAKLNEDLIWNSSVLSRVAKTIQLTWHWYQYNHKSTSSVNNGGSGEGNARSVVKNSITSASNNSDGTQSQLLLDNDLVQSQHSNELEIESSSLPSSPPYHLIDDLISRRPSKAVGKTIPLGRYNIKTGKIYRSA